MKSFSAQTYALMRIVIGLLFLCHGTQKLFAFPSALSFEITPFITYGAGLIECLGGLLVTIGLFTRLTAFVCSGLMATAYWMAHGTKAFFPIDNGGELAVIYCFVFLFISAYGSGIWSADSALIPNHPKAISSERAP